MKLDYKLVYMEVLRSPDEIEKHIAEGSSVFEELSEANQKVVLLALKAGDTVEIGRVAVFECGQEFRNEMTDHHYVFFHKQQRIGIGYADSLCWADVDSPTEGLELFFRNRDAFDDRN